MLSVSQQLLRRLAICAIVCGLYAPLCAAAGDLRDYAARLKRVQFDLEAVREGEDGETEVLYKRRVAETLALARRMLPDEETVNTPEGPLPVSNKWLDEALHEYAGLDPDSSAADTQLENIALRMAALRVRVDEANKAAFVAAESPDEAKARLERILRRPEYGTPDPQDNALTRLIERIKKFFRALLPKRAIPLDDQQVQRASPWTLIIVCTILLATLILAAWRILPWLKASRARRLTKRQGKSKPQPRIVLGEKLEAHETAQDIFAEAERLAHTGDWRAAIRKGYIATLCLLSDRKLVRLEEHKTNRDYLREVAGQETLARPLGHLTNRFEYHWYGLAPADAQAWDDFRNGYRQTTGEK